MHASETGAYRFSMMEMSDGPADAFPPPFRPP